MATVTFRQGVGGYAGTWDTRLLQADPTTDYGSATIISADLDRDKEQQALLLFLDIFGSGPGQIPNGATITSATLTLNTTSASIQGAALHRMLTDWSEAATWNSLGNGIQFDDQEALATPDLVTGAVSTGSRAFDVTASLRAWANGAANHGWAFHASGTDGWDFRSSESSSPPPC